MPFERFFSRRQKKNAEESGGGDSDHRELNDESCNRRQAPRQNGNPETFSAQKNGQPAESENYQRVRRPGMESFNYIERPVELFAERDFFVVEETLRIIRIPESIRMFRI